MAVPSTIVSTLRTLGEPDWAEESRGTRAVVGAVPRSSDVDRSRRRVLVGGAAVLGAVGVAGTGAGVAGATGSQSGSPSVSVAFADEEVDAGDTTRLELVLSSVPDGGLTGWTFLVELTGSGSAAFTGEGEFSDDLSLADIDLENTDSDSVAYLNAANAGGVEAGDTDVLIGDVVVQGVDAGDVETDIEVQELSDLDSNPIDADVGSDSFTVVGSAPDLEVGDSDGGESADGDGSTAPDPAPGDGDGNSDSGGSDSDDADGDDGGNGDSDDGGNGDSDDGGNGDSDDGDDSGGDGGDGDSSDDEESSGDGTPGFGIGAAVTAVAAGTAARFARRAGEPDDGE